MCRRCPDGHMLDFAVTLAHGCERPSAYKAWACWGDIERFVLGGCLGERGSVAYLLASPASPSVNFLRDRSASLSVNTTMAGRLQMMRPHINQPSWCSLDVHNMSYIITSCACTRYVNTCSTLVIERQGPGELWCKMHQLLLSCTL